MRTKITVSIATLPALTEEALGASMPGSVAEGKALEHRPWSLSHR